MMIYHGQLIGFKWIMVSTISERLSLNVNQMESGLVKYQNGVIVI